MNDQEDGEFQEFSSLLKRPRPQNRYGQYFNHRHNARGGRLKRGGHGRGLFNRQVGHGHSEEICSTYGDRSDDDFRQIRSNKSFWPAPNVGEDNSDFISNGPKRHNNNEGFRHMHNPQHVSDRVCGPGNSRQNNRFHGRGLRNSNYLGNGHTGKRIHDYKYDDTGKRIHDYNYDHHSAFKCEDPGLSQVSTNDVREHPNCSAKQRSNNLFGHRGTLVGKGGRPFRGSSFKKRFVNFINKASTHYVNSNEVTTSNASVSGDLLHDGRTSDGIDPKACSKGSLLANEVGGSVPLLIKKKQKQHNSALTQNPLDCKHASQSSAPLKSESGKDSALRQEEDATLDSALLATKKLRRHKIYASTQSSLDCKHVLQSSAYINSESGKESGPSPQEKGMTWDNNLKEHETIAQKECTCHQEDKPTFNSDERHQEWELREAGTSLQDRDTTFSLDQRHHERAFISCIGGGNRKRRRSAAVRDFPVGCGSLRISVVKKMKTISELAPRELLMSNTIAEVGSLSDLELTDGTTSNASIADVHEDITRLNVIKADKGIPEALQSGGSLSTIELIDGNTSNASFANVQGDVTRLAVFKADKGISEAVQSGGKSSFNEASQMSPFQEDSSFVDVDRMDVTKTDGITDFVQFVCRSPHEKASKTALSQGDTYAELVSAKPELHIERGTTLMKEENEAGLVQANLEVEGANCNESVLSEEYVVLDSVPSMEVAQKECNLKVETVAQTFSNEHSHLAFESSHLEVPCQESVIGVPVQVHTSSQGVGLSGKKEKHKKHVVNMKKAKRKSLRNQKVVCPLQETPLQSKLKKKVVAEHMDTSNGIRNQNNASKKVKVQNLLEVTESSQALVPFLDSKIGSSIRNKDSGKRLVHKGLSRVKHSQTSRSLDTPTHYDDPAKGSGLEIVGGSARSLVKQTLHEFESIRKSLVKNQDVRRADLEAGSLLKERGKWRNCEGKIVGEVPGVEVGDQFSFRMEMLIIGLHRQVQGGIDYIPATKRDSRSPLATSIVASGGYEDDKDDGNVLIYSGQGGNNAKGNKKQESNQVLARGNLAMSNSMKEGTPVRVIRGISDLTSPSSKIYTYDGLYDVVDFRLESSATGYGIYHFTLTRRPGQPQVGLSILSSLKKKGLARPHLLLHDISGGQERLPICVVNEVDEEPAPLNFTYIPKIKHPVWYAALVPQGCDCAGVCDEETCSCAVKNGGELPYNEKAYLLRDKNVVYECGTSCSCSVACQNRVSQKGLRYRLEVFKTKNRGWGVRSLDSIQSGGFICEYTGELLTDAEAEKRIGNDEYLFDLGNKCNPSHDQSNAETDAEDVAYTIDAKDLGNVARFINHSCSPNLYPQNVLYDSDDKRFSHVMLFAMESIPPMRELTYDYNYSLDQVCDALGNVKIKACYCGAQDCQGRLY